MVESSKNQTEKSVTGKTTRADVWKFSSEMCACVNRKPQASPARTNRHGKSKKMSIAVTGIY